MAWGKDKCYVETPSISQAIVSVNWGRVTHICVSKLCHHLSRRWLVACSAPSHHLGQSWLIVNWILCINFSEILIERQTFSLKKTYLKISSAKWRPSCLGLNVLTLRQIWPTHQTFQHVTWGQSVYFLRWWLTPQDFMCDFAKMILNAWVNSSTINLFDR